MPRPASSGAACTTVATPRMGDENHRPLRLANSLYDASNPGLPVGRIPIVFSIRRAVLRLRSQRDCQCPAPSRSSGDDQNVDIRGRIEAVHQLSPNTRRKIVSTWRVW